VVGAVGGPVAVVTCAQEQEWDDPRQRYSPPARGAARASRCCSGPPWGRPERRRRLQGPGPRGRSWRTSCRPCLNGPSLLRRFRGGSGGHHLKYGTGHRYLYRTTGQGWGLAPHRAPARPTNYSFQDVAGAGGSEAQRNKLPGPEPRQAEHRPPYIILWRVTFRLSNAPIRHRQGGMLAELLAVWGAPHAGLAFTVHHQISTAVLIEGRTGCDRYMYVTTWQGLTHERSG